MDGESGLSVDGIEVPPSQMENQGSPSLIGLTGIEITPPQIGWMENQASPSLIGWAGNQGIPLRLNQIYSSW